ENAVGAGHARRVAGAARLRRLRSAAGYAARQSLARRRRRERLWRRRNPGLRLHRARGGAQSAGEPRSVALTHSAIRWNRWLVAAPRFPLPVLHGERVRGASAIATG